MVDWTLQLRLLRHDDNVLVGGAKTFDGAH